MKLYRVVVKTLVEEEVRNVHLNVSNNFDDFMEKITEIMSRLEIANFRIDYKGNDGEQYCILHEDGFQQFLAQKVDNIFVRETARKNLPAVQQTPPAKITPPAAGTISCRSLIYRVIGYFVPQSHHKLE
ncbi:hypothetical protein HA402_011677 [Bradysia odoriphaga]|nr:hypothetical protein HA402_011677 [Bradysia odoriphaga]